MMSTLSHPLVTDYLDRLRAEAVRLPADQGRDLEASIREHFAEALPEGATEVQVRETIDRLGEPAELVDAAGGAPDPAGGHPQGTGDDGRDSGNREVLGLALLLGAAVTFALWFLSWPLWVAGVVTVALARRWSVGEKLLALASWGTLLPAIWVVVGSFGLAAAQYTTECVAVEDVSSPSPAGTATETCTTSPIGDGAGIGLGLFLVLLAAYLVFVGWATWRLARAARRAAGAGV